MTCSSIYGDGNSMWILHFVYIGHEFITRLIRHFENRRGEGPGDEVGIAVHSRCIRVGWEGEWLDFIYSVADFSRLTLLICSTIKSSMYASSGYFVVLARNCLTSRLDYNAMRKGLLKGGGAGKDMLSL